MSSVVASHFVLETGVEPIMQVCLRDKNRISIQSDLYGAYALGIRNILFITGDHSMYGLHPEAKSVYDIDSVQALDLASLLSEGYNILGEDVEGSPDFYLGATFNPGTTSVAEHIERTQKKVRAGARFFQTQCIFDASILERFMSSLEHLDLRILAGIVPLQSPEMAIFMNENVPEVEVPADFIRQLEEASDKAEPEDRLQATRAVGLQIALDTIEEIRQLDIQGLHIMGVNWEESVVEIVRSLGLLPRPPR
jgi:5,10-methylenetetrahydrofolate reductase